MLLKSKFRILYLGFRLPKPLEGSNQQHIFIDQAGGSLYLKKEITWNSSDIYPVFE